MGTPWGRVTHGGNLRWAADTYQRSPEDFLDLSANINVLGLPPGFHRAIQAGVSQVHNYPDPDYQRLRESLANAFGLSEDRLAAGNGSTELLYAFFRSLANPRFLVVGPTFQEYARALALAGGTHDDHLSVPTKGWQVCLASLWEEIMLYDGVVICNPNNPTGTLSGEGFSRFCQRVADLGKWVVVDEAFMDYVEDPTEPRWSVASLAAKNSRVLVFRSLTKFFGIPGLRLGCAIGTPMTIEQIRRHQEPWTINCVAEHVGRMLYASCTKEYRDTIRSNTHCLRVELIEGLTALGFGIGEAVANFVLLDTAATGRCSREWQELLGQAGILVRDCSSFPGMGERYVRVAVKDKSANRRLLQQLGKLGETTQ